MAGSWRRWRCPGAERRSRSSRKLSPASPVVSTGPNMLWFGPMGHDVPRVSNPARGRWRASGSAAQQRLTRRWWCPPPIVPNHALIEVDRKRCLTDAMGRADQPRLQVPNRAVRQWHHRRGAVPQGASERLHVLCSTVPAGRETWYPHADTSPATVCQHGVGAPVARVGDRGIRRAPDLPSDTVGRPPRWRTGAATRAGAPERPDAPRPYATSRRLLKQPYTQELPSEAESLESRR